MKHAFLVAALLCILPFVANAQFNSGSTGVDGALDLSTASFCQPNGICEVQLPESGILNYTTINVPPGRVLIFKRNSRNSPAILLAQGNVTVGGEINVSTPCAMNFSSVLCTGHYESNSNVQTPGVGGFSGGAPGKDGFGSGKGIAAGDINAKWVGPLNLLPIVGGSGGAGYTCGYPFYSCRGGGGGGAIVIASSAQITISGAVKAIGSESGSGGAIRLIANSLDIAGQLSATSRNSGVIRLEAPTGQRNFTGTSNPAAVLSTINPSIVADAQPLLTIVSVGGYLVPSYAGTRFDTADLQLPNQLTDPINVVIQAANIPSGTPVQVGFANGGVNATSTSCTLTGGPGPLQCTATISNLNRTGVTYLLATATFTPPANFAQLNPKGENNVAKIRLESILGAKPKYVFLRNNNSVIDNAKLPKDFLQQFGM
ncbi:MAG: hypothetical protein M3Q99_09135 [Acidobacteriota bacterium]|nr:hypothetical protein [Acidobacteriota bacterium]